MTKVGGRSPIIPRFLRPQAEPKPSTKPAAERSAVRDSFSVTERRGLFRTTRQEKATLETADASLSASRKSINGRTRETSVSAEVTQGNTTRGAQLDQTFRRNGELRSSQLSTSVQRRYSPEATFESTTTTRTGPQWSTYAKGMQAGAGYTETGWRNGSFADFGNAGTRFKTNSGKHSARAGVSYRNDSFNTRTETTLTHDFRAGERGTEADAARQQGVQDLATAAARRQNRLNVAADLGLSTTVASSTSFNEAKAGVVDTEFQSADGNTTGNAFVGARATSASHGEVGIGVNGITAQGFTDNRAGLYAEGSISHTLEDGSQVSGQAGAALEAFATAQGLASIDSNGVVATGGARIGVQAEVSAQGRYNTANVTIGGVEMNAGVEARGRLAAEATAHANGQVAFTRHPPRAVVQGEAGASAVLKAEGDVKLSAGPFAVRASGYGSVGAEARAHAGIGYDDGKLSLNFGAGAALGVGLGGSVNLEVDVKQIGQAAVGLAKEGAEVVRDAAVDVLDVSGDGRIGLDDARVVGERVGQAVEGAVDTAVEAVTDFASDAREAVTARVDSAVNTARDIASDVGDAIGSGIESAGDAIGDGLRGAGDAISNGASRIASFFSGW